MRLPLLGTIALLQIPAQTVRAVQAGVALVPRLIRIVGEAEDMIGQVRAVVLDASSTQRRALAELVAIEPTRRQFDDAAANIRQTIGAVDDLAAEAAALIRETTALLSSLSPALLELAPAIGRLADNLTVADVDAAVGMIRAAPPVLDRVESEVLPVLSSLDTVAPSLEELVDASADLSEMVGSVPGMGKVKKRLEKTHQRPAPEGPAAELP